MHSMNGYVISNFVRPQRSKVGPDRQDLLPQLFQNTTNIMSFRLLLWLFFFLIRLNLNFMVLDYLRDGRILLLCPASARDFSTFVDYQGDSAGHVASQLMHTAVQRPGYEPRYICHLPLRLRTRGCITPLPHTPLWRAHRLYFALLHFNRATNL